MCRTRDWPRRVSARKIASRESRASAKQGWVPQGRHDATAFDAANPITLVGHLPNLGRRNLSFDERRQRSWNRYGDIGGADCPGADGGTDCRDTLAVRVR